MFQKVISDVLIARSTVLNQCTKFTICYSDELVWIDIVIHDE